MSSPPVRSFYRIAKNWPPADRAYRTNQDKKGPPEPGWPGDLRYAWTGLSMYDSEAVAREQARKTPFIGRYIVRFDIPVPSPIEVRKTFGPGHFTIKGNRDDLKRYLAPDYVVPL